MNVARNKRLPPRGMYVNHDDLQEIASGPDGQGETILSTMDDEVVSLKCKVCCKTAFISFFFFFFRIVIFNDPDTVQQARNWTDAKKY